MDGARNWREAAGAEPQDPTAPVKQECISNTNLEISGLIFIKASGISFLIHCPSGKKEVPLFLLCIHVYSVATVLTMACQPLQDPDPPIPLTSFVTTFRLTHFVLAPLLFLKQANSMTAPGPLH